jgi:hypothetical protein
LDTSFNFFLLSSSLSSIKSSSPFFLSSVEPPTSL